MRIRFENASALMDGILAVAPDLGFTVTEGSADLTVTVSEVGERTVSVTLDGDRATITYGDGRARFLRGLARLLGWLADGKTQGAVTENPLFAKNGGMFSVSRGGVLRVETVKATMRKMALMGMNTYMLYTEDTFEVDGFPYFGRARGRYLKAELKEMDAYALSLGIELIPCIQVLGHLSNYLSQKQAYGHKDTESVLLVGADETYALIDGMLSTVAECFTTRRVHIGMDETFDLGSGKYLDKFGYRPRSEIFFEHLARVREMAERHGLDPMMWSDMFFRLAGKGLKGFVDYDLRVEFTEELRSVVPKGVRPIFWDYYNADAGFYRENIEKHRDLFDRELIYAGGIWLWSGQGPLYSRSFKFTYPALDACRETGVREVFATIWGGDDSHLILAMPGLAWFADYDYVGGYDEASMKRTLRDACHVDYDTLMLCELPEHPDGKQSSLTRGLLYNDPLLGLADKHFEELPMREFYRETTARLEAARPQNPLFAPAYELIVRLSSLLEYKADFGVRLKRAYDAGDRDALSAFLPECDLVLERLHALRDCHYRVWMYYNKPQGWELHDIRYGGLIQRFDTVKRRITDYLEGRAGTLEELDEERLRLYGEDGDGDPIPEYYFLWKRYRFYATNNTI